MSYIRRVTPYDGPLRKSALGDSLEYVWGRFSAIFVGYIPRYKQTFMGCGSVDTTIAFVLKRVDVHLTFQPFLNPYIAASSSRWMIRCDSCNGGMRPWWKKSQEGEACNRVFFGWKGCTRGDVGDNMGVQPGWRSLIAWRLGRLTVWTWLCLFILLWADKMTREIQHTASRVRACEITLVRIYVYTTVCILQQRTWTWTKRNNMSWKKCYSPRSINSNITFAATADLIQIYERNEVMNPPRVRHRSICCWTVVSGLLTTTTIITLWIELPPV